MTKLEKFVAFAEGLPPDKRREVESLLDSIMDGHGADFQLTAEELAELDRRMADANPDYADPEEVEAIFRRYDKA